MTPRNHTHRCTVRSSTTWHVPPRHRARVTIPPTTGPTMLDVVRFRVQRVGWTVERWLSYGALVLALFAVGCAVMVGLS